MISKKNISKDSRTFWLVDKCVIVKILRDVSQFCLNEDKQAHSESYGAFQLLTSDHCSTFD